MANDRTAPPTQAVTKIKSQAAAVTRNRLLQAACQIIQTEGMERLTLDAVARESQISKGGLLYHFASKEALIVGTIQYLMDSFEADIDREIARANSPESPGSWLRAYVQASFNCGVPTSLVASLLSVVTTNPELLKPVHSRLDDWHQKIHISGLDPVLASLVRLAADGVSMSELFGIPLPNELLRQQVLEQLLAMIQAAESSTTVS